MLSFFRRLINSRLGIVITLGVLVVIALAFALGDVTGLRGQSAAGGDSVASVGSAKVSVIELRQRAQNQVQAAQQQQPGATMADFIAQGGLESTLEGIINGLALQQFGAQQGMVLSKRLIDGQIASLPAFQGPDGKFSQTAYNQVLQRVKLSDRDIREDIARETMQQQLLLPTLGATQVASGVALPYASLLLEKRSGQIAIIPARAVPAGPAPTEAELATFYGHARARYTVPERRVIRYAVVTADQVKAKATPSDAEVAKAYAAQRAKFSATEKRSLAQVVLPTQAAAAALVAKVKGGTSIEDAARAAGLEANAIPAIDKAAYTTQNSPEIAAAVFGAARGSVVGPIRSALGFTVVRINTVEQIAGKSLDQAKPEIVKQLTTEKTTALLGSIHDALDDAIGKNATFDEIVGDQKLTPTVSPPLTTTGADPDNAASKPDPKLAQVVAAAFAADQGDAPQLVPVGTDGFAVVALGKVVPAAPRPIGQVHDALVHDFVADRQQRGARIAAASVVAAVNKGAPLDQALAATKLQLPKAQAVNASRAQLAANPRGAPPPLVLMFSMAQKNAKLLEAPNNAGWFLVYLDRIEPGDAAGKPNVIAATGGDLGKVVGREYVQQFSEAVRRTVGVKKNDAVLAQTKAALSGQGGSDQP